MYYLSIFIGQDNTRIEGRGKDGGIVPGHAYSILKAYQPYLSSETIKLVQLRNPWGSFEWTGNWSDKSEKWKQYPLVKAEIWPNLSDNDGCFWMEWCDFLLYYDQIDVVYTGGDGLDSVSIQIQEDCGGFGSCLGGIIGCGKFWCLCSGCYRLWCAPQERQKRSLDDIIVTNKVLTAETGGVAGLQY